MSVFCILRIESTEYVYSKYRSAEARNYCSKLQKFAYAGLVFLSSSIHYIFGERVIVFITLCSSMKVYLVFKNFLSSHNNFFIYKYSEGLYIL